MKENKDVYFAIGDIVDKHFSGIAFKATYEGIERNDVKQMDNVPIDIIRRIDGITIAKTKDKITDIVVLQDAEDIMESDMEGAMFDYGGRYVLNSIGHYHSLRNVVKTNRIEEIHKITSDMYVIVDELKQAYPVIKYKRV